LLPSGEGLPRLSGGLLAARLFFASERSARMSYRLIALILAQRTEAPGDASVCVNRV